MPRKLPLITEIDEVIRAGGGYRINATITNDGTAWTKTAQTVTASLYDERDMANPLIEDFSVTITSASNPLTVRIDFAAGDTSALHTSKRNPQVPVAHIFDFHVVNTDGTMVNSDPVRLWVAGGLT